MSRAIRSRKSGPMLSPASREIYRDLGKRLRRLRTNAGMSVVKCAVGAHVARRTLEGFESGQTIPSPATLSALYRLFGWQLVLTVRPLKPPLRPESLNR